MSGWDDLAGEPLAPHLGPFPHRPFLETCRRHWQRGSLEIVATQGGSAAVVIEDGVCRFAGERHLTDYHSTLGQDTEALVGRILELVGPGVRFDLDSLPIEAAEPLVAAFGSAGLDAELLDDESCRVVELSKPAAGAWEEMLGVKHRHELRRKRRRFARGRGEAEFGGGREYFDAFVSLHRSAAGDKGGFMTDPMASFFADLLDLPGSRLDVLLAGDSVAAAAFGFEDVSAYYLYNSAYDPRSADLSPGIVLIDRLMREAATSRRSRFDFLKGNEEYKIRLGAASRPLYRLRVWS